MPLTFNINVYRFLVVHCIDCMVVEWNEYSAHHVCVVLEEARETSAWRDPLYFCL
jgi:hypothetical protein